MDHLEYLKPSNDAIEISERVFEVQVAEDVDQQAMCTTILTVAPFTPFVIMKSRLGWIRLVLRLLRCLVKLAANWELRHQCFLASTRVDGRRQLRRRQQPLNLPHT